MSYLNNVIIRNQFSNVPIHVKRMMIERSLYNPVNWKRFIKWWRNNIIQTGCFDEGAALDEIDKTLSYSEAIDHIVSKHPEWFKNQERIARIKQVVFIKQLIPLLITNEIKCTYRNRRLCGSYYVITNRFKRDEPTLVIEVTDNELMKTNELTDEDAKLAGIDSVKELRKMLIKWYSSNKIIFRNWLTVKQILCEPTGYEV